MKQKISLFSLVAMVAMLFGIQQQALSAKQTNALNYANGKRG